MLALRLFFPLYTAAAAAASSPGSCASFKVYWGFSGPSTADPASPPLDNSSAGLPYLFEPAAQSLIKRNPGTLLPYCVTQPDGSIASFNGGVPQNATATPDAYFRALTKEMTAPPPLGWGVAANWSGVGALDFPFKPDFAFAGNDPCVATLSAALVRASHPTWNASQVLAEAAAQFHNASLLYFGAAMHAGGSATNNKARWGFLGFPVTMSAPCVNAGLAPQCGYHHPAAGPAQKAANALLYRFPYQAAFPAIELSLGRGAGEWDSRNKDAIYGVVEQARAGNYHVDYAVLPVLRARYADAPTEELRAEDLAMVLAAVVQAGANGLVIEGNPFADAPAKAAGFAAYLASTLGPAVRAAVTDNCACAEASCSDAGNCVGLRPRIPHDPVANDTAPACYCRLSYYGDACNISAAAPPPAARLPVVAQPPRLAQYKSGAASSYHKGAPAPPLPSPGCPSVPPEALFPQFWNIVDWATPNRSGPVLDNSTLADAYLFTAGNQSRTGAVGGDLMPNCRTAFNKTANASYIQIFNGGIPQLANLTALFENVRDEIAGNWTGHCKPSPKEPVCPGIGWGLLPDFEGNAVFDFENWRPVFAGQWNDPCMTNLSIAKVEQEHPAWTNSTQVYLQAELEFETAAMDIFVGMIEIGKAIAPRAKWGFYGYPANLFYGCNNQGDLPQCGYHNDWDGTALAQKEFNEKKYQRLWEASTGLFPSIYLMEWDSHLVDATHQRDFTVGNVEEAVRLRDLFSANGTVVRPFAWNYYMQANGDAAWDLERWDLAMMTAWPKFAGADGLIWWGAPYFAGSFYNNSAAAGLADFYAYLNSTFGPGVKAAVEADCACSIANCSSRGTCIGPGVCRCMAGFGGADCAGGGVKSNGLGDGLPDDVRI